MPIKKLRFTIFIGSVDKMKKIKETETYINP